MTEINASLLFQMFESGCQQVQDNCEYIDKLNIFPVPDGDTGTNMKMTVTGAIEYVKNQSFPSVELFCNMFSRGLLMNARGNSGVIFSQIMRGFSKALIGQKTIQLDNLLSCFLQAKETAYKAVTTVVEGTILTVIRVISEKLQESFNKIKTIKEVFSFVAEEGWKILQKTPELLVQLKEANVVDSGGYALCCFLQGLADALNNDKKEKTTTKKNTDVIEKNDDTTEGFGYCCEFILKLGMKVSLAQEDKLPYDEKKFKAAISALGDSFVYVHDDDLIKVHIHSIYPHELLKIGQKYGEFIKLKFDNLTLQFLQKNPGTTLEKKGSQSSSKKLDQKQISVMCTLPTKKLETIYKKDFNIDNTIVCEKNANPSTQQFLSLIQKSKTKKNILVVDNGNAIMAAKEAIKLVPEDERTVKLIECKDIGASYLSCLSFDPNIDFNGNVRRMNKVLKNSLVGKISISVKNIKYKNIDIKVDDYIAIIGKEIIYSSNKFKTTVDKLVNKLASGIKARTAIVFCGNDVTDNQRSYVTNQVGINTTLEPKIIESDDKVYLFYIILGK